MVSLVAAIPVEAMVVAKLLTIRCTATASPPLRGYKPAREPGVMNQHGERDA